jgi:hypothetical protein
MPESRLRTSICEEAGVDRDSGFGEGAIDVVDDGAVEAQREARKRRGQPAWLRMMGKAGATGIPGGAVEAAPEIAPG